ncbi:DUF4034 domain-containing protein [Yersinia nurmii]|uniref:DUF4034 domain-containing protein n=1 Tax=Yersinia nurmii TaxID=685706 RepID=A0AAW7K157_9GAMM|nr:DUF4034 domain-containing protein [Yersinia nurmii]MDN0086965.1 DUF4034 domain-containing protein [Yersinia nurmii]CNE31721.1 Sel1 domain-containing protein [Yersinia nurmii]
MASTFRSLAPYIEQREHLRSLLASHQFDALDSLLDAAALRWLESSSQPFDYDWIINTLFDPAEVATDTLSNLNAWIKHKPMSYHGRLLHGCYWEAAAARIRTSNGGEYVSDDRWVGAQLARDLGLISYLRAISLHERPAYALRRMLRLTAYLGEPQWLYDLAHGHEPTNYVQFQAETESEVWEAGLRRLLAEGGDLASIPQALPESLPARRSENVKTYWLNATLAIRPQDVGVRNEYLYFLYPRWGGSHEQMAEFIEGPVCAVLSEQNLNLLWITKAWDFLGYSIYFPDKEQADDIAYCCDAFEQLLALDLEDDQRARVLYQYANFLAHYGNQDGVWQPERMQPCYDLLAQAWQVNPAIANPQMGLDTLMSCINFAHINDSHNLLPQWLERLQLWGNDKYAVILAGVASKFGLYGIKKGQFNHQTLLARAAHLDSEDVDVGQAAANLFGSVSEEAGIYLLQQACEWGDTSAMATLSDVYAGVLSRQNGRDMETYKNNELRTYWMERAADGGDATCQYNFAYEIIEDNEQLSSEQYQQARVLLLNAMNTPNVRRDVWERSTRRLATLLMFSDIQADMELCLDVVLPALWSDEEAPNHVFAAGYYALAFHLGAGCNRNSYLAKVWLERGLEIDPDDSYLADRATEIYRYKELLGSVRAKMGFGRDKKLMDQRGYNLTFDE